MALENKLGLTSSADLASEEATTATTMRDIRYLRRKNYKT